MNIIDAHFHFSGLKCFREAAQSNGVNYSLQGFEKEYSENRIVSGVCMGLSEGIPGAFPDQDAANPMKYDLAELPENFYFCAGVNPHQLSQSQLANLEQELNKPQCVGVKIYAGYYHYYLTDSVYQPVYELALKYNLPVVIHTGDTYSPKGLLKYSHPLIVDELAVCNPELKILIAHLGNPWLMDTAEILYKNKNVYGDLSGLQVGDSHLLKRFMNQELYMNMFRTALILADSYDKLLFGSDWPLAPMSDYIEFIKQLIPEVHHQAVFYDNALRFFSKMKIQEKS